MYFQQYLEKFRQNDYFKHTILIFQPLFQIELFHLYYFSKAARGRPEGPTERSVFKIFFVMLAIF